MTVNEDLCGKGGASKYRCQQTIQSSEKVMLYKSTVYVNATRDGRPRHPRRTVYSILIKSNESVRCCVRVLFKRIERNVEETKKGKYIEQQTKSTTVNVNNV